MDDSLKKKKRYTHDWLKEFFSKNWFVNLSFLIFLKVIFNFFL